MRQIIELTREEALERFNADWIAMDSNGNWRVYYNGDKPKLDINRWVQNTASCYDIDISWRNFVIVGYAGDWKDSIFGAKQVPVSADESDIGKVVVAEGKEVLLVAVGTDGFWCNNSAVSHSENFYYRQAFKKSKVN